MKHLGDDIPDDPVPSTEEFGLLHAVACVLATYNPQIKHLIREHVLACHRLMAKKGIIDVQQLKGRVIEDVLPELFDLEAATRADLNAEADIRHFNQHMELLGQTTAARLYGLRAFAAAMGAKV